MADSSAPTIRVDLEHDDYEKLSATVWFSYDVCAPKRPLPSISVRGEIRTDRLIVRPLLPSDLEAFHELRKIGETQIHSTARGRPDRDVEETRQNLERLQAPHDQRHWYWGAFLASTGELIGEAGLPDSEDQPTSGWTRFEILLKPAYWRQGYGTELFKAVMEAWWKLPGEKRRRQLLPMVVGDKEPGEEVPEAIELIWEAENTAAQNFFTKTLGQSRLSLQGSFVGFDWREGREGNLETTKCAVAQVRPLVSWSIEIDFCICR
ncbi:acyltransferase [Diaporthe amygdali]|uniref:acyltransferase n=1 Tax=Phomopsis amygdali TaxID=1214568 RepID=UPI0022FE4690|nr:acyltransferase [Diaporthe amygdali]KAJ0114124.1 acyltransferase [Diaporthe amygdali]